MVNETWHGPFRQSHETCRRAGHVTFMHRHERKDDEFVVLVVMGTVSMDDRFIAVPGYPGYPGPSPPWGPLTLPSRSGCQCDIRAGGGLGRGVLGPLMIQLAMAG